MAGASQERRTCAPIAGKKSTSASFRLTRKQVRNIRFNDNRWKDPEFVYGKFLDLARYLVVWQPILFFILHLVIDFLKK